MKDLTKVEGTIAHALVVRKDELNKAMSTANERKAKEVFCNILDTSEVSDIALNVRVESGSSIKNVIWAVNPIRKNV